MEFLKKSIEIIFSPLGITTILIGAGVIVSCIVGNARAGRRLLITGGGLFLVLLFSPLSEYLVLRLEREYPPMLNPPTSPKIEKIVVLAGYAEENKGFPITTNVSEQTICTISEAFRLYRMMPGAKMILSGGIVREGEKSVAASMAEFLQQMGVPSKDIVVEGNSKNTYENLMQVNKIVGTQPFVLVAQACDLRRAMAVARKINMLPIAAPACYWALQHHTNVTASENIGRHLSTFVYPSIENLSRIQWAYHEYTGYLWYQFLDRI